MREVNHLYQAQCSHTYTAVSHGSWHLNTAYKAQTNIVCFSFICSQTNSIKSALPLYHYNKERSANSFVRHKFGEHGITSCLPLSQKGEEDLLNRHQLKRKDKSGCKESMNPLWWGGKLMKRRVLLKERAHSRVCV